MANLAWHERGDTVALDTTITLTNALSPELPEDPFAVLAALLAVDPPSTEGLRRHHVTAFHALSLRLREIIEFLDRRDVDDAALRINELLVEYPARPHLAKEDGQWRLHHHPIEAELVAMWSAITADALARLIGAGRAERAGICEAEGCSNAFIDGSKNGTRRFCSTTCQNRVKAASFRRRSR